MLAQSRVRGGALCAELGALQSTHSALLLREELTMTVRDREERGGGGGGGGKESL